MTDQDRIYANNMSFIDWITVELLWLFSAWCSDYDERQLITLEELEAVP